MVIQCATSSGRRRGVMMTELLVAMMLLVGTLLPVAYSFAKEKRLARSCYEHAIAMEIVDGEMETLLAGEWRALPAGTHVYDIDACAATNLPPGRFLLTIQDNRVRLEWRPAEKHHGGPVVREAIAR